MKSDSAEAEKLPVAGGAVVVGATVTVVVVAGTVVGGAGSVVVVGAWVVVVGTAVVVVAGTAVVGVTARVVVVTGMTVGVGTGGPVIVTGAAVAVVVVTGDVVVVGRGAGERSRPVVVVTPAMPDSTTTSGVAGARVVGSGSAGTGLFETSADESSTTGGGAIAMLPT